MMHCQRDLGTTHDSIRKMMVATASFELANVKYLVFVKLAWFGNKQR